MRVRFGMAAALLAASMGFSAAPAAAQTGCPINLGPSGANLPDVESPGAPLVLNCAPEEVRPADAAGGNRIRIFRPATWTEPPTRNQAQFLSSVRSVFNRVYEPYARAFGVSPRSIDFVITERGVGGDAPLDTLFHALPNSGDTGCRIFAYDGAMLLSGVFDGFFKQGVAHEIAHCFQYAKLPALRRRLVDRGFGLRWWLEGTAEYIAASRLAYPCVNAEHRFTSLYNPNSTPANPGARLTSVAHRYPSSAYFHYLAARENGPQSVVGFMTQMTTSANDADQDQALETFLAAAGRRATWPEFIEAFFDRTIADECPTTSALQLQLDYPTWRLDGSAIDGGPANSINLTPDFAAAHFAEIELLEGKRYRFTPQDPDQDGADLRIRAVGSDVWRPLPETLDAPCGAANRYMILSDTRLAAAPGFYIDYEMSDLANCACEEGGEIDDSARSDIPDCALGSWRLSEEDFEDAYKSRRDVNAARGQSLNLTGKMTIEITPNKLTYRLNADERFQSSTRQLDGGFRTVDERTRHDGAALGCAAGVADLQGRLLQGETELEGLGLPASLDFPSVDDVRRDLEAIGLPEAEIERMLEQFAGRSGALSGLGARGDQIFTIPEILYDAAVSGAPLPGGWGPLEAHRFLLDLATRYLDDNLKTRPGQPPVISEEDRREATARMETWRAAVGRLAGARRTETGAFEDLALWSASLDAKTAAVNLLITLPRSILVDATSADETKDVERRSSDGTSQSVSQTSEKFPDNPVFDWGSGRQYFEYVCSGGALLIEDKRFVR